jgi:hypothetical protein
MIKLHNPKCGREYTSLDDLDLDSIGIEVLATSCGALCIDTTKGICELSPYAHPF